MIGREGVLKQRTRHAPTQAPMCLSLPSKTCTDNDNYNRREYVVKVLVKVVEGYTVDDAIEVMQEAHESGVAMVIAGPQDEAERYCEGLRLNGLSSTIEPGC